MSNVNILKLTYQQMLDEIRKTPEIKQGFYQHNVTKNIKYTLGYQTDDSNYTIIYLIEMRLSSAYAYLRTGQKQNITKYNLRETDALNWYRNATYLGNKKPDNQ